MAYSLEDLLLILRPYDSLKVQALQQGHRKVENGLTTVGLKLHCLEETEAILRLLEGLGGRVEALAARPYRYRSASITWVLPALGNVRSAIMLIECLELFLESKIFNNPRFQIQVCSPCRLEPYYAGILSVAFYLGSDLLRQYQLGDFSTTFSIDKEHLLGRGRRIALYDGTHVLDREFQWWDLAGADLHVLPLLPFTHERTDILVCQTREDMRNVNLLTTLLSHHQEQAYWEHLGRRLITEMETLLRKHELTGILQAPWIHPGDGSVQRDSAFFSAYKELEAYAYDEYERMKRHNLNWWNRRRNVPPGILLETRQLLNDLRDELVAEVGRLALSEGSGS